MRIEHLNVKTIKRMLIADGYIQVADRAVEIREAAKRGCLLWTRERLTTTDSSRIDERSRQQGGYNGR